MLVARSARWTALLFAVVVLAACGTTLSPAQRNRGGASAGLGTSSQSGGGSTDGLGGTTQGGSDTSTAAGGAGSLSGGGGPSSNGGSSGVLANGGSSDGGSLTGGTDSGAGGASLPPGVSGPGVTDTSIYVGMIYTTNGDVVNKAGGANGITSGNQQADGMAVINDINKHGGIAGRKLVPKWFQFDSTSTATVDSQYQAACAFFTQDKPHVFAVLGQGVPAYRRCIHNAGAVQIDDDLPDIDAGEFKIYPALVEMGYPNLNRVATEQAAALADQNYFSPWNATTGQPGVTRAKVGIITYDDASHQHAVDGFLVPALKKLGYDPGGNIARITPVSTAGDYGNQAASVSSAQLKFAAAGVDHVIMFESNGGLSLFFMNTSESQHYHPRYGVNSTSGLEVLINAGDVQKDQAVGAVGFGWDPGTDLTADRNPDNGPYSNPDRRACLAIMKAAGQTFSDVNAEGIAISYCANLWLLRNALNKTPSQITSATFVQAINSLGSNVPLGGALGEFLSPTQHDGVSRIYYWDYFADCQCLHYTGPIRPIP